MTTLSPLAKAGVIGWPVTHSLSPRLHEFWINFYGITGSYRAIPVTPEDLPRALRNLPVQGLRGVNLTIPHKEAALSIMDTLDETAQRIGAVNLVIVGDDGRLHGRNTDAYGFINNMRAGGFTEQNGTAIILGAGGAARAIIVALQEMRFSQIFLANRTLERAKNLAHTFSTPLCPIKVIDWESRADVLKETNLLVNTTSLGMTGQPELGLALNNLHCNATVTDVVYKPLETNLLCAARERGHLTIDGLGMLLHQARPSFKSFFGRDPDVTPELREYVLGSQSLNVSPLHNT